MPALPDPYMTLGLRPSATDAEVRSAYRRLVQLHHPDHNNGSEESARRFEEVQEAYAQVRRLRVGATRRARPSAAPRAPRAHSTGTASSPPGPTRDDSELGARLAALEEELKQARDEAMRQARRAAARAQTSGNGTRRPSDEELGYFSSDDSLSKILTDATSDWSGRLDHVADEARASPVVKRFADLIDELGSKLTGDPPGKPKG